MLETVKLGVMGRMRACYCPHSLSPKKAVKSEEMLLAEWGWWWLQSPILGRILGAVSEASGSFCFSTQTDSGLWLWWMDIYVDGDVVLVILMIIPFFSVSTQPDSGHWLWRMDQAKLLRKTLLGVTLCSLPIQIEGIVCFETCDERDIRFVAYARCPAAEKEARFAKTDWKDYLLINGIS